MDSIILTRLGLVSSQDLTLWEQMDNGAEFTPAKKYLTAVPVVLWVSLSWSEASSASDPPIAASLSPAIMHD